MLELFRKYFIDLLYDIAGTDSNIVLLVILLVMIVIVLDAITTVAQDKKLKAGLATPNREQNQNISKTEVVESGEYVSEIQGIAGKPDAVLIEEGFYIPVSRKPMAKKIRDRYVAQLLIYMRLIEEFEGKRPPYGYLILGKNKRQVKIMNTAKRQRWLDGILDEMKSILDGSTAAIPSPQPQKCKRCNVRHSCDHALVTIKKNDNNNHTKRTVKTTIDLPGTDKQD